MKKSLEPKILFLDEEISKNDVDISYECGRCPPSTPPQPTPIVSFFLNENHSEEQAVN